MTKTMEERSAGYALWGLVGLVIVGVVLSIQGYVQQRNQPKVQTNNSAVIVVRMQDMHFEPESIVVPAGAEVNLKLENHDTMAHDLRIGSIHTPRIAPGSSQIIALGQVDGELAGYCTIAGHKEQGMTLIVRTQS